MAVASAGFRLAHAVLHKDSERAASLAKEITATTRNGVLPKEDCGPAIMTLKPGDHGALFRLFQQHLGAVADDVLMPANRNQREEVLRQFFESIARNYFERALVDVVGLLPESRTAYGCLSRQQGAYGKDHRLVPAKDREHLR